MNIQWYPGHMAKTRRMIEENLKAVDLVVVHELCHIQVKNHGPDFYALLEQVLPDWRERKKLLR